MEPRQELQKAVDAVRSGGLATAMQVEPQLRRLPREVVESTFRALIDDPHIPVQQMAFRVLRWAASPASLKDLGRIATDGSETYFRRRLAVEVVGAIGEAASVHSLRAIADELLAEAGGGLIDFVNATSGFDFARLLIATAKACARCGDHSLAEWPMLFAARPMAPTDDPEMAVLYDPATEALSFVVADGMIEALRKATQSGDVDGKRNAVHALFHLGLPQIVGDLIGCAADDDVDTRTIALVRFHDLTGAPIFERPADAASWWEKHRGRFGALDQCYRSGKPISIEVLLAAMKQENHRREELIRELLILTGIDLAAVDSDDQIKQQIAAKGIVFAPGALMRSGRACAMPSR